MALQMILKAIGKAMSARGKVQLAGLQGNMFPPPVNVAKPGKIGQKGGMGQDGLLQAIQQLLSGMQNEGNVAPGAGVGGAVGATGAAGGAGGASAAAGAAAGARAGAGATGGEDIIGGILKNFQPFGQPPQF